MKYVFSFLLPPVFYVLVETFSWWLYDSIASQICQAVVIYFCPFHITLLHLYYLALYVLCTFTCFFRVCSSFILFFLFFYENCFIFYHNRMSYSLCIWSIPREAFFCIAEILQSNFLLYKKSAVILYSEMFQKHPRIHNMTTD